MKKAELFHNCVLKLAKILHVGVVIVTQVSEDRFKQGYAGSTKHPRGMLKRMWDVTTDAFIESGRDRV